MIKINLNYKGEGHVGEKDNSKNNIDKVERDLEEMSQCSERVMNYLRALNK